MTPRNLFWRIPQILGLHRFGDQWKKRKIVSCPSIYFSSLICVTSRLKLVAHHAMVIYELAEEKRINTTRVPGVHSQTEKSLALCWVLKDLQAFPDFTGRRFVQVFLAFIGLSEGSVTHKRLRTGVSSMHSCPRKRGREKKCFCCRLACSLTFRESTAVWGPYLFSDPLNIFLKEGKIVCFFFFNNTGLWSE